MFEYSEVPQEIVSKIDWIWFQGCVRVLYRDPNPVLPNWIPKSNKMPHRFREFAERIKNFEVRSDDVWIITPPKCGTTWTQEMVWMLMNNLDYETSSKVDLTKRCLFLEFSCFSPTIKEDSVETTDKFKGRRFIKSHLPLNLLPNELWTKNPTIFFCARNPKDAVISHYHHQSEVGGLTAKLEDYMDAFLEGELIWGRYFEHVDEFIRLAEIKPNIFINTFEDMKFDMMNVLKRVCQFIGMSYSEEELKQLEDHLKFENMKKTPTLNMSFETTQALNAAGRKGSDFEFMRKGKVGTFKEEMPKEYIEKFDKELDKWNSIRKLLKI